MEESYRELEWHIRRFEMLRRVIGNRIVDEAGLQRGRLPILEFIREHEGASQREIAEVLHISAASVAVTIRRMEKDGLIVRREDVADQRINRIYSTALAGEKVARCHRQFRNVHLCMIRGFDAEEITQLEAYLRRLFDNLAGDEHKEFPFYLPRTTRRKLEKQEETDD